MVIAIATIIGSGTYVLSAEVLAGEPLQAGDPAPALWSQSPRGVSVAWVFRTEDCLSCNAPSFRLRQIQQAYGSQVAIFATAVGVPSDLLNSFLARERLKVDVVHLRKAEYRQVLGRTPLPALYLVKDGDIVGAWYRDLASVHQGEKTLEEMLGQLLVKEGPSPSLPAGENAHSRGVSRVGESRDLPEALK
jgi:hypothetical protein